MPLPRAALLATLLLAGVAGAPGARAVTATPEQVQAVTDELNAWFRGLIAGTAMPGDHVIAVRPDGDAYALSAPLGGGVTLTGHLAPQADGYWMLSDVILPSPSTYTITASAPPSGEPQAAPVTRSIAFSAARQETTGTLDPSYATPSSVQQRFDAYQLAVKTESVLQLIQLAHVASQSTLTPASTGRLDVANESTLDGMLVDQRQADGKNVRVMADRGHVTMLVSGLARDHGPAFTNDLATFVALRGGNQPQRLFLDRSPLTAAQRAALRTVLDDLDGLASGAHGDVEANTVQVQADKIGLVMRLVRVSYGAEATDSVLKLYLDLGTEGLSIPGLSTTPNNDLIPTRYHLRPILSGIGTKELLAYARAWLDSSSQGVSAPPDLAPLFAHGGITAGLDDVAFDLGPAELTGHGKVTFTAPGAFTGEGQVAATGLDALLDRAKESPGAQQVVAVIALLKGIGRAGGDRTVWDVTYAAGELLVNGIDVLGMAGKGGNRSPSPLPQ